MKTCIVITKPNQIQAANNTTANLLELRTDLYKKFSLTKLVHQSTKPVIVTIKNNNKQLLQEALDLKVAYIDIDYQNKLLLQYFKKHNQKSKLIVSYHNFQTTPSLKQLQQLIKRGVNKIAVTINHVEDNWIVAQLLQQYPNSITVIGMEELGIMTRLYPKQRISYFAMDKQGIAPGQLPFSKRHLKLYGIIGNPVQHSLSPKLHNTWFKQHHILALYQRWETNNLKIMMNCFQFFNLAGASVTMPYKQSVMPYLDNIHSQAKKIGAVNTIVRRGKKLIGYNTDWVGMKQVFNTIPCLPSLMRGGLGGVLILGRGGVARAIAYAAKQAGAKLIKMVSGRDLIIDDQFDILVNATPVRDELLVPKAALKGKIIMDCNYGKATKLVKICRSMQNVIVIDGFPIFTYQAAAQFKLWTHLNP